MINAAIVGLGRWGRNMVNAVQGKSAKLRFVRGMVRHPEAARDFAAQHGLDLSGNFADVLADKRVQAVVLATPPSSHLEHIVALAGAGKAVLAEKPLTFTRADAGRAIAACRQAGVALGVGHDKRFMASMRELRRVVAGGTLGDILHLEGHLSNENSRRFSTPWRDSSAESPGASLTGTGVHIIDAFVNIAGPAKRVQTQLVTRKPAPAAIDALSVLIEFESGAGGVVGGVRTTPYFWRVHVFGTEGSVEAIGPTELVLRMSGAEPQRLSFETVDTLRAELDAFADAVEGRAPYPISGDEMVATVAAFEAAVKSIAARAPVEVGAD